MENSRSLSHPPPYRPLYNSFPPLSVVTKSFVDKLNGNLLSEIGSGAQQEQKERGLVKSKKQMAAMLKKLEQEKQVRALQEQIVALKQQLSEIRRNYDTLRVQADEDQKKVRELDLAETLDMAISPFQNDATKTESSGLESTQLANSRYCYQDKLIQAFQQQIEEQKSLLGQLRKQNKQLQEIYNDFRDSVEKSYVPINEHYDIVKNLNNDLHELRMTLQHKEDQSENDISFLQQRYSGRIDRTTSELLRSTTSRKSRLNPEPRGDCTVGCALF